MYLLVIEMTTQEIPEAVAEAIEIKERLIKESNDSELKKRFIAEINDKYFNLLDDVAVTTQDIYFEHVEQLLENRRKALEVWR